MTVLTEPILVNAALAAIGLLTIGTFIAIIGMRDQVRDMHGAIFGHNGEPGALTTIRQHEARLNRHSDALRSIGALSDE